MSEQLKTENPVQWTLTYLREIEEQFSGAKVSVSELIDHWENFSTMKEAPTPKPKAWTKDVPRKVGRYFVRSRRWDSPKLALVVTNPLDRTGKLFCWVPERGPTRFSLTAFCSLFDPEWCEVELPESSETQMPPEKTDDENSQCVQWLLEVIARRDAEMAELHETVKSNIEQIVSLKKTIRAHEETVKSYVKQAAGLKEAIREHEDRFKEIVRAVSPTIRGVIFDT